MREDWLRPPSKTIKPDRKRFACAAASGIPETSRLILVVEFVLGLFQHVLLMFDRFFLGSPRMFSFLFERVLFLARERTGCCRGGIGLLSGYGRHGRDRCSRRCRPLHNNSRRYKPVA